MRIKIHVLVPLHLDTRSSQREHCAKFHDDRYYSFLNCAYFKGTFPAYLYCVNEGCELGFLSFMLELELCFCHDGAEFWCEAWSAVFLERDTLSSPGCLSIDLCWDTEMDQLTLIWYFETQLVCWRTWEMNTVSRHPPNGFSILISITLNNFFLTGLNSIL